MCPFGGRDGGVGEMNDISSYDVMDASNIIHVPFAMFILTIC